VLTTDNARRPDTHPAHQPEGVGHQPNRQASSHAGQNNPVWPRGSRQELPRCGEEAALLDAQSPVVLMPVGQHTISLCPSLRACLWASENLMRHPRARGAPSVSPSQDDRGPRSRTGTLASLNAAGYPDARTAARIRRRSRPSSEGTPARRQVRGCSANHGLSGFIARLRGSAVDRCRRPDSLPMVPGDWPTR
jgi:hypothetical protein